MKKLIIRVVLVVVVLLVVAIGVSVYCLGSIVKKGVETVGPQITGTEIKLDSATLSLLSGSGRLKGLFVGNPEGFKTASAIKVGAVSLGVAPRSVFSDKVHVKEVRVEAPEITFEGGLKGNNLSRLLDNVQAATGGSEKTGAASQSKAASKKLQVDDFVISGGKINLSVDAGPLGAKSATVSLPEIHLTELGQDANGITAAELTQRVLKEILQKAIPAAEKAVVDLGATGVVKDAGKAATERVEKATKGIGDLFKKK